MKLINSKELNVEIRWNSIFYGTALSLATAVVLSLLMGAVIYVAGLPEIWLTVSSDVIYVVSILAGAIFGARNSGQKGLIHGIIISLLTMLFILLLTMLFPVTLSGTIILKKILLGLFGGALGGILGVK